MCRLLALALLLSCLVVSPAAATVAGDYLEARTADVWTGPCFANAEVGLAGLEAVLAWRVEEGSWDGVELGGYSVVAVVTAEATLGDPHAAPGEMRSLLLIDERAGVEERRALRSFARDAAGDLLAGEVVVETAPIRFSRGTTEAAVVLEVGERVRVATRPLGHHDHHCGNETVYYPPLVERVDAVPAVTLEHRFESHDGAAAGRSWSSPGRRSAFVGRFGG